jgi:putative ABC transport system permease protein
MSRIRGISHRFRVLVDPDGYAREVEREIRFHLDHEAMHKRGLGLPEPDAEYAARCQFGNVTYVREEVRRMSGQDWIDRLKQNIGYAVRGLRQSPGFTAAVVLILGLGLGVNAAMFSFLDQLFLKAPSGVAKPAEVRRLYAGYARKDEPNGRLYSSRLHYPQAREIRRAIDTTTRIGLFWDQADSVAVTVGTAKFPVQLALADADYFRTLGIRPQLGRIFDEIEDQIVTPAPVAIISDAMWKRVFNSDPRVVGSTFRINYQRITVIGVAPKDFSGIDLGRCDLWLPLNNSGFPDKIGTTPWYDTYQAGFSAVVRVEDAAAERRFLDVASRIAAATKVAYWGDSTVDVRSGPIQASLGPAKSDKEHEIAVRLGGVGLIILLITLANVSNLLLVRATRREREIAVRRALGVSRRRLFEQLLTESVLLAVLGGTVSILLAVWAGAALRGLLLPEVRWASGILDPRLMAFALGAAALTGIIVGVVPAVHAWRPDLVASLRAGGKSGAYRRSHLRNAFLVVQTALSVVLLVGSGLFVRSLHNVHAVDVGFDYTTTHVVTVFADTGSLSKEVAAVMPTLLERAASIPGIESVAAADGGPMLRRTFDRVVLPGHDSLPVVFGQRGASKRSVTAGYFRTVGQRILQGREFARDDAPSIIVEEAMAKAYWPGESALGKCLIVGKSAACRPIIGVAANTHSYGIVNDKPVATFYTNAEDTRNLLLRFGPDKLAQVSPVISSEVKRLVPRAAWVRTWPVDRYFESELRPWRLGATLFTAMGGLALIVAAVGAYSVIAYAVSQRANEMGIRVALGARIEHIATLVIGDGLRTILLGAAVGVVLALAAGRLVASLLYGISPRDPMILAAAAIMLAVIGVVACLIPALRAARVDPVTALRAD